MKKGTLFGVLFFAIFYLIISFASGADPYKSSWTVSPGFDSDYVFHKKVAKRLANAKMASGPIEALSNVAAFGLTLSVESTTGEKRFYCIEFPNVLYSSYSVTEAEPVIERGSKEQVIAVSDLFRGTPLTSQTQKHQLCSFILWLLSKPHFSAQGDLVADLMSSLETIQKGDAKQLTSISNSTQFRVLQRFLHCEQLFLYKMLAEDYIVDSMVHQLFQKKDDIFNETTKEIQFFLEESTYNDMCPNCFLSMKNMIGDVQEKVGKKLLQIMSSDRSLTQYMTKCLPVKLGIRISSFRPFKDSRIGAELPSYFTYHRAVSTIPFSASNVVQFFNPWVSQYLLLNRFQKLQRDLEDFSSCIIITGDRATILDKSISDLLSILGPYGFAREDIKIPTIVKKEFGFTEDAKQASAFVLKLTAELNELLKIAAVDKTVLSDITKTLFSCKGTINHPALYGSILPLAVMLANVSQLVPNEEFFRNLFWVNSLLDPKISETEFTKLKLPETSHDLMSKIQQDITFTQKFVLPMPQMLLKHTLEDFVPLFQATAEFSTALDPTAFNLLCQNILLPKVFSVISSIDIKEFQRDVLPHAIMLLQPLAEPAILQEIGQHIRNMFAMYSVSEVADPKIIQQQIGLLEKFKASPSITATILDQSTLLSTISLSALAEPAHKKMYDTKQINVLCQTIKTNMPTIHPQIVGFVKKQLAVVKNNLDKITWFSNADLQNSKTLLQQILEG